MSVHKWPGPAGLTAPPSAPAPAILRVVGFCDRDGPLPPLSARPHEAMRPRAAQTHLFIPAHVLAVLQGLHHVPCREQATGASIRQFMPNHQPLSMRDVPCCLEQAQGCQVGGGVTCAEAAGGQHARMLTQPTRPCRTPCSSIYLAPQARPRSWRSGTGRSAGAGRGQPVLRGVKGWGGVG